LSDFHQVAGRRWCAATGDQQVVEANLFQKNLTLRPAVWRRLAAFDFENEK
jgi:hypothetical protein